MGDPRMETRERLEDTESSFFWAQRKAQSTAEAIIAQAGGWIDLHPVGWVTEQDARDFLDNIKKEHPVRHTLYRIVERVEVDYLVENY